MTKTATCAALALSSLFLAGCWQANGSLYTKASPVTPFHAGAVTETGGKQGTQHFALTLAKDGTYRMIGTDKGEDHGEGFALHFFNLRGIPENMVVYEAASLAHCDSPKGCDAVKPTDARYYGLLQVTAQGAAEIRPDCKKDTAATEPFGIKEKDGTCTFITRDSLETSLVILAQGDKKPEYFYRLK